MSCTREPLFTVYVSPEVFGSWNFLGTGTGLEAGEDGANSSGDWLGAKLFSTSGGGRIFSMNFLGGPPDSEGVMTAIFIGPGGTFMSLYSPSRISDVKPPPPCSGTNVTVPTGSGLPW